MIRKYSKLFAIAAAVGLSVVPVSAKEITFDELQDLISETTSYETEAKAVHIIGEHVFTNLIGDNYDDEDVIAAMESINNVPSAKHSYFLYTYGDEGWTLSSQVGNKEGKLNEPFNITTIDTIAIEDSTSNAIKTAREEAIDAIERYRKNLLDNSKYDQDALDKVVETYTNEINKANTIKDINDNITEAVKEMEAARIRKEESKITIDTEAIAEDLNYMKENWGYDSALNNQLEFNKDTLTFAGNVAYIPTVNEKAFDKAEERTGYYLTYTLHIPEEYNTDNLVITVTSPLGTKTYGKQENGTLTVLNSINPADYVTKGKVTITVDFDGEGELYDKTTYVIDYTGVKLGKVSELNLDNFDVKSETYLKQSYGWEKPEKYLNFTGDEKTNTVYVSGTLDKYSKVLTDAGFANDTQYYLGFRIPVITTDDEDMKTSTVEVTVNGKTLNKANFDNKSDIFTIFMLNPAATTEKTARKIEIVVDKDGATGKEYSATTYYLDWSNVKFAEGSTLKEISTVIPESDKIYMRDEWNYENNSTLKLDNTDKNWIYKATGDITEQPNVTAFEKEETTGFYFAYNLILNTNTTLNGKLTKEDLKNIQIKITNSANGKEKIFGVNDLTFGEDGTVSLAMLTHINPNDKTKTVSVYVDFDGNDTTFGQSWYQIDYSQLKLIYNTSLKVNEIKAGDAAATELKTNYGYSVDKAGRITLNSNIDASGNPTIYAHGFALQTKLGTETLASVFGTGKDNGYYLPLNLEISHASKIKSITFKVGGTSKEVSSTELGTVKDTGKLNALVILANDKAEKEADKDKFTIEVEYDSTSTETLSKQIITIDTTNVKFGAKGLYEVAYNTTNNTNVIYDENTTIVYGSDEITEETEPRVIKDLFNEKLMSVLTPSHIKAEKVVEFNQNGTSKITFAVNGGHFNDKFNKESGFNGTRANGAEGFFDSALKFTVEIDANNHIISVVSDPLTLGKEISTQNKYIKDSYEYVVKSIVMNFTLSGFTKKDKVDVVLSEENTLQQQATSFTNEYYGKVEGGAAGKSVTFGTEEFNVEQVYTKIGKVENTNVSSITVNGVEYNNKNVSISIDKNAFIVAPRFVIMDDELYVSTTHLMALNKAEVTIICDGVTYTVTTGIDEKDIKDLIIQSVTTSGEANAEKNKAVLNTETDPYTITHTTNNGKNAILIDVYYDGGLLKGTNNYMYSLAANGNMGITTMEDNHTYGAYTLAWGQPATATDAYEQEYTLIVPGKGTVKFNLIVVPYVEQ